MAKTILVLAANPESTPALRLDKEIREIDNGLRRSQKRDEFALKPILAARQEDVRRAMLDHQPSIVHFCGHGLGDDGIVFEDDQGAAKFVSTDALTEFFALFADHLECVILNACYSEVQAEAIAQYIPYVVGMKGLVDDKATIEFVTAFYDALGAGRSVDFAYKLACNSIDWTGKPDHLRPILKSRDNVPEQQKISYSSSDYEHQIFYEDEEGEEIFSIAFSQDKKWLAAGSERKVLLWDVQDGKYEQREEPTAIFPHDECEYVYAIAFSPNSKYLVTAGQDMAIRMWDVEKQELLWKKKRGEKTTGHQDAIYSVAFSPDGKEILTGSYDKTVRRWNAVTGDLRNRYDFMGRVSCVAYNPGSSDKEPMFAIATHTNSVILKRPKAAEEDFLINAESLHGKEAHHSSVEAIAFSPDGRWLASCGLDKAVVLWDVEKKMQVWRREGSDYHEYVVRSIAISPDGQTLASAGWDKKILLWDMEGENYQALPVTTGPWHKDWIWSVAFSADGKVLASGGSDGQVMIWRYKTQQ